MGRLLYYYKNTSSSLSPHPPVHIKIMFPDKENKNMYSKYTNSVGSVLGQIIAIPLLVPFLQMICYLWKRNIAIEDGHPIFHGYNQPKCNCKLSLIQSR